MVIFNHRIWGNFSIGTGAGSSTTVTFPIAVTNIFDVDISVYNAASEMIGWTNATNTSINIVKGNSDSVARTGKFKIIAKL